LPWNITADLLARELSALNVKHVEDVCHIFAALSINSRGIQRAAYHVLNRVIPRLQEAVSFDVALSDAPVNLPDELMSLLLDPPTAASIRQQPAQDTLWLDVRSYLLSWKAVFDHFIHSVRPNLLIAVTQACGFD
jgi:[phosphatase 2A protein]-leucine-carboxy methyltransferase